MNIFYIIIILVILVIGLFLLWRRSVKLLKQTKFSKISLSTKYGKMTEQFMPFLKNYPHDPNNFRFIGTPIDGIQFSENEIIFIEFKTASSTLSAKQRAIKNIVKSGKIEFEEIKI